MYTRSSPILDDPDINRVVGQSDAVRYHAPLPLLNEYTLSFALFASILWFVGALYYSGNIGKWLDDYTVAEIDPVTGQAPLLWVDSFPRPLGWTIAICKSALLWQHDRIHHLISALTHAFVAFLFWRLLRQLLSFPQLAAGGALLFLTFPLSYEMILWPSAMHAVLATAGFLGLTHVYLRYARGVSEWVVIASIFLLCFVILCLWEQPVTGVVALPFLYLAVCSRRESFPRRVIRSLLPVMGCCALVILCMWITRQSVQAGQRGGADSLTGPAQLYERIQSVGVAMLDVLGPRMRDQVCGGLKQGLQAMTTSRGCVCFMVMIAGFGFWLRTWGVPGRSNIDQKRVANRLWLACFGAGIMLAGWVPVVAIKMQTVETRLFYYPLLGAILMLFSFADWVCSRWAERKTSSNLPFNTCFVGMGCCIGLAAMGGAVSLVGAQHALRQRHRMDRDEMAQLKRLAPSPPSNTIFVPLRTEHLPVNTGYNRFDQFAIGALATPWSAPAAIQQAYRRRDLFSTYYLSWGPLPLNDFDASSARYHMPMPPFARDSKGGSRLPWKNMLPFIIDTEGKVCLVSPLWVEDADGNEIKVPSLAGVSQVETRPYTLWRAKDRAEIKPLSGWQWSSTGQPVEFADLYFWGVMHSSASIHPAYPGNLEHGAMQILLDPCTRSSRLFFRATFTPHDLMGRGSGDGVELIWYLKGQRGSPLGTLHLTPQQVREEQRWVPVNMTIPAHAEALLLQMEVGPGPAGNYDYDACLVTVGQRRFK